MTNRIRALRNALVPALSQAVVARRARMSQATLSAIEVGRRTPSPLAQKRIAKALRASVEAAFPPEPEERDDEPRRKLTRQERLQGMADRGYDTLDWEER